MGNVEEVIVRFFEKNPHVIYVALFGSYARNTETEKSDVDVAFLCKRNHAPPALILIEWRETLAASLGKDVDLVCLNDASPIIGMQVYKYGKTLSLTELRLYSEYLIVLFVDYAELKTLRAPMEKNILKRKFYD